MPAPFDRPTDAARTDVTRIKQEFGAANPEIDATEMAVVCNGRYLQEVRICLDQGLRPRACGRDVRDRCRRDEPITVRPLR